MSVAASSLKQYSTFQDLIPHIRKSFEDLNDSRNDQSMDVTPWMDIIRTCRQPQVGWEIDYLQAREEISEINELIVKSTEFLFESETSSILCKKYTAHPDQLSAFNTIRIHLLAEQKKFICALDLLNNTHHLFDKISLIRQSNLLFHGCMIYLCNKEFEKSYDFFNKHWALVKYRESERISLGLMDNHVIVQMVYWFFVKYVEDFRDFYCIKNKIKVSDVWNHKKVSFLHFLEYDCAWVASFCGLPFYEHARELMNGLPKYEKKRSTPTNVNKIWTSDEKDIYSDVASGDERYYYEQYNREIDHTNCFPDWEKAEDYLFSYYYYQTDYTAILNDQIKLIEFIKRNVSWSGIESILALGSGINRLPATGGKKYQAVEASEKIFELLFEKEVPAIHSPVDRFMEITRNTFDLCFAYNSLNRLPRHRLINFLKHCSQKCKNLAAMISTQNEIRSDILSTSQSIAEINLNKTIMSIEEWNKEFENHFQHIRYEICGTWLLFFCSS